MIKRKKKSPEKIEKEREDSLKMKEFFISQWAVKPHYSEISGVWLGRVIKSIYMHHILPNYKHLQAALDPENLIFLTFEEHQKVEQDMYFYEEINRRRELLKIK